MIFKRPELADAMAKQLLEPGVLDEGLRSGLFLSGLRRTGKTTFIKVDLIPALESRKAVVIYVDLWSNTLTSPADLVHQAIIQKLEEIQQPGSKLLEQIKRLSHVDIGVAGLKFGFKIQDIGKPGGVTLADAFTELVDLTQTNLVLIIDEVQQALATEEGNNLLLGLKAARDAINPRPDTPGHFIFIGTGSHRAQLSEMTSKRNQAFAGATSTSYPLLEREYISFLLDRLSEQVKADSLPSLDVAYKAFKLLGNRPEEMIKAFREMVRQGGNPAVVLPIVAQTLRTSSANGEILKVENLGLLAQAVFAKVASSTEPVSKLFSAEAAKEYSSFVGREVRVEDVQPVVGALMAENLIMRVGHGSYTVSDPFVGEVWKETSEGGMLKGF